MHRANERNTLLALVELGGYPDFTSLYKETGYRVFTARSLRKGLAVLKKVKPAVIVAEFNYQSAFRDRTSNLESLFASVQRMPGTKVIVFHEREYLHQLERLQARFPVFAAFAYPVDSRRLADVLQNAMRAEPESGLPKNQGTRITF